MSGSNGDARLCGAGCCQPSNDGSNYQADTFASDDVAVSGMPLI